MPLPRGTIFFSKMHHSPHVPGGFPGVSPGSTPGKANDKCIMSTQEVREEALLNIRCVVKGYHLCRFEVNVGEVFTANKKRREENAETLLK